MWNQVGKLVVSKQDNLVIKGDTVTIPEGVTVKGDLWVKNGKLKIESTVDGDVTLVKSKLISDKINGDGLMASISEVNGEMQQVDEAFEWMWFIIERTVRNVFSLNVVRIN